MIRSLRRSRAPRATGAFTLVEIVLVVAIMATLGGLVVVSLQGADDHASSDLAMRELHEVRRAVLQFRADTGFLPKRGPFNIHPADVGADGPTRATDHGAVRLADLPLHPAIPDNTRRAWFDAPANLWQLFLCPLQTSGPNRHPLSSWDPQRRRGWRGPYLTRGSEGWVAVSGGLLTNGTAAWPTTTAAFLLPPFPAVADAFLRPSDMPEPTSVGRGFRWTPWNGSETGERLFGRPVLLLDLDPGQPGLADDRFTPTGGHELDLVAERARVVSLGTDGIYDPVPMDAETRLSPCVANDDLGLFLLR